MESILHWTKEKPSLGGLVYWRIAIMFKAGDKVVCTNGCVTLWTNREYIVDSIDGTWISVKGIQGWFADIRFKLKEKEAVFKVGDKVICISDEYQTQFLKYGNEYEIVSVNKAGLATFVRIVGKGDQAFNADRFKLKENVVPEQVKKVPHKHAALIKAWADGAKIQTRYAGEQWRDADPQWFLDSEYRIKPEKVKKEFWVIVKKNTFTGQIYTSGSFASLETANERFKAGGNTGVQYLAVHKIEIEVEL